MSANVMSVARTCTSMDLVGSSSRPESLCIGQAGVEWGRTATRFYSKGRRSRRRRTTFSTGYEICFSCRSFPFGVRDSVRHGKRKGSRRYAFGKSGSLCHVQPAHRDLFKAERLGQNYERGARRDPRVLCGDERKWR